MLAKVKPKRCKVRECRKEFIPFRMQSVCSPGCAQKLAEANRLKERAKKEQEERRVIRAKLKAIERPITIIKRIKLKCQEAARIRDRNEPCISCRCWEADEWHGGHFMPADKYPLVQFDLDNINKQCNHCNMYRRGNVIEYERFLLIKRGPEVVQRLKDSVGRKRYTREELAEIEAEINKILKALKKGKE